MGCRKTPVGANVRIADMTARRYVFSFPEKWKLNWILFPITEDFRNKICKRNTQRQILSVCYMTKCRFYSKRFGTEQGCYAVSLRPPKHGAHRVSISDCWITFFFVIIFFFLTIRWGKFSQKHNYEYLAKWWCLLVIENYMNLIVAPCIT